MPDAPDPRSRRRQEGQARRGASSRPASTKPLVHQSVRAEQAARRRGTAATKTRGMVSGGGAKPWRQKGTGRARAGSNRSPIWTGGGTVFGPQPRSYTFKVNRKEQRAALRSALSLHAERGSLAMLDASAFSAPKTKQALDLLDDWNRPGATLVVLAAEDANAALSFRNLARRGGAHARERRRRRPARGRLAGDLPDRRSTRSPRAPPAAAKSSRGRG